MMTTKKNENSRRYKLKTDRARIKLEEIKNEYLPTDPSAAVWKAVQGAALARIDDLPDELMKAVKDRCSSPGEAQAALQAAVYLALTDISSPDLVDKASRPFVKKARRS